MKTKTDFPQIIPAERQFTALFEVFKHYNRKLFNIQNLRGFLKEEER